MGGAPERRGGSPPAGTSTELPQDFHTEAAPLFRGWFRALELEGISYRVTSTRRSLERQAQLYAEWRAGRSRYPVALPGRSTHNYGLAADVVIGAGDLRRAVVLGREWGLRWFGPSDAVHWDPFGPAEWRRLLRGQGL